MGQVIEGKFPLTETIDAEEHPLYLVPEHADRTQLTQFVINAVAELFQSAVMGQIDEMDELRDFLEECFLRFDPPLTQSELDSIYQKSLKVVRQKGNQ